MKNVNNSSRSWLKRTGLFLLAALLILAMGIPPLGEDASLAASEPEYDLGLYIGSPLTISKGEMKPLDSTNLNVAPILYPCQHQLSDLLIKLVGFGTCGRGSRLTGSYCRSGKGSEMQ